ncbi:hypothetical protein [Emticicia sp. W12TSBA100-4]|uniref:hypothetical protein n=1 Tax=Emticicia sp. W12TSBA100-4 TaxID=3160965 RepID=UPI003306573E
MIYRGKITIKNIAENYVTIQTQSGQEGIINLDKISSKIVFEGDTLQHCEHGFYDVIDANGNYIFRHSSQISKSKNKKWWQFWV